MARIMKINRELIKPRKHNEKHGFYEVSKFQKMRSFDFLLETCRKFIKNEEIIGEVENECEED